jgi:hypothetical protein
MFDFGIIFWIYIGTNVLVIVGKEIVLFLNLKKSLSCFFIKLNLHELT